MDSTYEVHTCHTTHRTFDSYSRIHFHFHSHFSTHDHSLSFFFPLFWNSTRGSTNRADFARALKLSSQNKADRCHTPRHLRKRSARTLGTSWIGLCILGKNNCLKRGTKHSTRTRYRTIPRKKRRETRAHSLPFIPSLYTNERRRAEERHQVA